MSQSVLPAERHTSHALEDVHRVPSAARCGLVLVTIIALLRTLGFRRTLRLVRWATQNVRSVEEAPFEAAELVAHRVATAAAFYPGRALCLEQSLTLYYCLHRLGIPAVFRIGVQPIGFVAHAWVEYRGVPILESELVHTVHAFPEIPA
jgi:hypothetical protein